MAVGVLTELSWADWIDKSGRLSSLDTFQALCNYFKNSLSSLVPLRNLKAVIKNVNFPDLCSQAVAAPSPPKMVRIYCLFVRRQQL